ncbi:MAG: helix-turn-helix transcriptional regulator [Dehalococcoidia bacterium]|nr:helix-turn-helix transcriptional regulator [Dehalococcoidia bacterium]
MNWKEVKRELLTDPRVAEEYEALEPEYQLARSILAQRLAKGLSQRQLAARAGTKQPAISRLEGGAAKPSLRLLERVADALDADVVVRLEPHRRRVSRSPSTNTKARRRSAPRARPSTTKK